MGTSSICNASGQVLWSDDASEMVDSILADADREVKLIRVFASSASKAQLKVAVAYLKRMLKLHPGLDYTSILVDLGRVCAHRRKWCPDLPTFFNEAVAAMPLSVQREFFGGFRATAVNGRLQFPRNTPRQHIRQRVPLTLEGMYVPGTGY